VVPPQPVIRAVSYSDPSIFARRPEAIELMKGRVSRHLAVRDEFRGKILESDMVKPGNPTGVILRGALGVPWEVLSCS